MIPGEYLLRAEPIVANAGRDTLEVEVANLGDRPIQVGSHMHFFEVNKALQFPRHLAFGRHLDIAAGTAVRFEPGDRKRVALVAFAGSREVQGLNDLCNGPLNEATLQAAMQRVRAQGFGHIEATGETA